MCMFFVFFKQKTAYDMRISDWSSDVCSSDLLDDVRVIRGDGNSIEIQKKYRPNQDGALPGTWWDSPEYSASESGTKILKSLFKAKDFDFPKSINLVIDNQIGRASSRERVCQ